MFLISEDLLQRFSLSGIKRQTDIAGFCRGLYLVPRLRCYLKCSAACAPLSADAWLFCSIRCTACRHVSHLSFLLVSCVSMPLKSDEPEAALLLWSYDVPRTALKGPNGAVRKGVLELHRRLLSHWWRHPLPLEWHSYTIRPLFLIKQCGGNRYNFYSHVPCAITS